MRSGAVSYYGSSSSSPTRFCLVPSLASSSKNGAPDNIYRYLKVYLHLTRRVPITEETDVAMFIPKTSTIAGEALVGAAEGNALSLRGVTYYSRRT